MPLTKTTEWEGEHVRLVKLGGLPGRGFGKRRRPIEVLFVHQSAGGFGTGTDAALAIAEFHTAPPKYTMNSDGSIAHYTTHRGEKRKHWIGGGRGLAGCTRL